MFYVISSQLESSKMPEEDRETLDYVDGKRNQWNRRQDQ